MAARTTSFTVPPSARLMVLTSSSDARDQVQRRCRPMCPLSDDPVAGHRAGVSFAKPRAVSAAWRTVPTGSAMAPPSAIASRAGSTTASSMARAASSTGEGSAPATRSSTAGGVGSGE